MDTPSLIIALTTARDNQSVVVANSQQILDGLNAALTLLNNGYVSDQAAIQQGITDGLATLTAAQPAAPTV